MEKAVERWTWGDQRLEPRQKIFTSCEFLGVYREKK